MKNFAINEIGSLFLSIWNKYGYIHLLIRNKVLCKYYVFAIHTLSITLHTYITSTP